MIYPKDFLSQNVNKEEDTVFVLMPFKQSLLRVYSEIKDICIDMNIECQRADDLLANKPIIENILEGIIKAEIIIVDLSDQNPNVFYELGIAHSLREQESVILLTQDIKNCPFDIRHWSILTYNIKNLPKLKTDLRERIIFSRKAIRERNFIKEYLRINGINNNEISIFIDVAEKLSVKKMRTSINLLKANTEAKEYSELEVKELLNYYTQLEEYRSGAIKNATSIIKLDVFSSNLVLEKFENLSNNILEKSKLDLIHLDDRDTFNFISDFCFRLIGRGHLKTEAISWLIEYLHNYRMGRIDIIRTKIENFLVQTDDQDINLSILEMLDSQEVAVRESAADICGQKKLILAIPKLIDILQLEDNPHVARSCIAALARLKANKAANVIYNWMKNNQAKWGEQAVSGSLKSVAIAALKEIDKENKYIDDLMNM